MPLPPGAVKVVPLSDAWLGVNCPLRMTVTEPFALKSSVHVALTIAGLVIVVTYLPVTAGGATAALVGVDAPLDVDELLDPHAPKAVVSSVAASSAPNTRAYRGGAGRLIAAARSTAAGVMSRFMILLSGGLIVGGTVCRWMPPVVGSADGCGCAERTICERGVVRLTEYEGSSERGTLSPRWGASFCTCRMGSQPTYAR